MENNEQTLMPGASQNSEVNISRQHKGTNTDLQDSPQDEEKMKSETFIIDLPDVEDIPGQEFVHVPNIQEMQDTTISSDDEEGVGLFGDDETDEDTDLVMGTDADVSATEQEVLAKSAEDMPTDDDIRLRRTELDSTDEQGDLLNEGSLATSVSGADLDTATADQNIDQESLGQGDEENSEYSLGSDDNDPVTEGTP
ncbi:MAG: hypothetical protein JWQ96_2352 [Segetibacter sp.]|nr:hypothetical protein [Segetibacter sp.]